MSCKLTIGEKIADLIHERGITADKLSKDLEISKGTISDLINNADKNFGYKNFVKLANYFNVSVDYLLGLSDVKTSDKDIKFINQYTGLSEKNIVFLHRNLIATIEMNLSRDSLLEQTNILIENDNFFFLLDAMNDYAHSLAKIKYVKEQNEIDDVPTRLKQIRLKNSENDADYRLFILQKKFAEIAKACAERYILQLNDGGNYGNN